MHELSKRQSEFDTHSGLHWGGEPMLSAWHEHTAMLLCTRHRLNGPQGDGEHGSIGVCATID